MRGRTASRFLKAIAVTKGDFVASRELVERTPWDDRIAIRAAIDAMATGAGGGALKQIHDDFFALVRPQSIIGQLANLRRVPFSTRAVTTTSGATASWVAEGAPKPVSALSLNRTDPLPQRKVSAMAIITDELAATPEAEWFIGSDLAAVVAEALDAAFIDPANAGVVGERPASVTNGAVSITATTDPVADLTAAVGALVTGGGDLTRAAWVMHPQVYAGLALAKVAEEGGTLARLPVVTSSAVPLNTTGSTIALVDASGIELAGATTASLDTTTQATIQLDDAPDDPTSASTVMVSLWQRNLIGLLAEIVVNWRVACAGSVVYVAGADYA